MKLVTIGLITYNQHQFVEDALESILMQTYENIEVIIMDDASEDGTDELIRKYLSRLKRRFNNVQYFRNEVNSGIISKNVNKVLKNANGTYFKGLAGDDVLLNDCVTKLVEILEINDGCAMAYANGCAIDDTYRYGQEINEQNPWLKYRESGVEKGNKTKKLLYSNYIFAPSTMIRMSTFKKHGMYDESIPQEDLEFWVRISLYEDFYYLDEPLILYRRTLDSISNYRTGDIRKKLEMALITHIVVLKKYEQYVPKDKEYYWERLYDRFYNQCEKLGFLNGKKQIEECLGERNIAVGKKSKDSSNNDFARRIQIEWNKKENENEQFVSDWLLKEGIKKIAIYGFGNMGKRLFNSIDSERIEVRYFIDKDSDYFMTSLPLYSEYQDDIYVDTIIVALASQEQAEEICHRIKDKYKTSAIVLHEMIMS